MITDAFANVTAIALTSRSVEVTWYPLYNFAGYLIIYMTDAPYTNGGNVPVNNGSTTSSILTNLEENTLYTITVLAIHDSGTCINTLVTTFTDGK